MPCSLACGARAGLRAAIVFSALALLVSCRAAWQRPDRVVEGLGLRQGDRVADLGAGSGYLTFRLADAVGANGKVFAVEVSEAKVEALRREAAERGYANVEPVLAAFDDARLPPGAVDVVFLCNVYHHIDGRPAYFAKLRAFRDVTAYKSKADMIAELKADNPAYIISLLEANTEDDVRDRYVHTFGPRS